MWGIQLILKLFEKIKQKGYNETHGIVFIVSFSNTPAAATMGYVQE